MPEHFKPAFVTVCFILICLLVGFFVKVREQKQEQEIKAEIGKGITDTLMSSELSKRLTVVTDSLEKEIANTRRLLNDWQRLNEMLESENEQMLNEFLKEN